MNRGQKILLRLRHAGDRTQFLPVEQVTDTMLHELSHIVHGPHDAKFHALWDQLRDEHEGLIRKGYTGEGFLSEGHRLGGSRQVPMHEARRLARAAAEKRRVLSSGSGQRLGGAAPRPGQDIRNVIVSAIERRNKTLQGCGNTQHNEREIQEISDTATRNGFRTQAEEDAANEAAIAQALWELVQEDEKAKYGSSYIPPSALDPTGNGGGVVLGDASGPSGPESGIRGNGNGSSSTGSSSSSSRAAGAVLTSAEKPIDEAWTCDICTLINVAGARACDACGTERPAPPPVPEKTRPPVPPATAKRQRTVIDLTASSSPERPSSSKSQRRTNNGVSYGSKSTPAREPTWTCSFCGKLMERQWWTCSVCGTMCSSK